MTVCPHGTCGSGKNEDKYSESTQVARSVGGRQADARSAYKNRQKLLSTTVHPWSNVLNSLKVIHGFAGQGVSDVPYVLRKAVLDEILVLMLVQAHVNGVVPGLRACLEVVNHGCGCVQGRCTHTHAHSGAGRPPLSCSAQG